MNTQIYVVKQFKEKTTLYVVGDKDMFSDSDSNKSLIDKNENSIINKQIKARVAQLVRALVL